MTQHLTPLMRAAAQGDLVAVEAALAGPLDPKLWKRDERGLGAFELAASHDHRECAELILREIDPMEADGCWGRALHAAILEGPLSAIEWIAPKVDPLRQDRLGGLRARAGGMGSPEQPASALCRAVMACRLDALPLLWSEEASRSHAGGLPLLWVALRLALDGPPGEEADSRDACLRWLVHAGAPRPRRQDGRSLAMESALARPDLLELFLDSEDLWEPDIHGATIFHMLGRAPSALVERLAALRPDLAGRADDLGFTPLASACSMGPQWSEDVGAIEALLRHCDPAGRTGAGNSPLFLAIQSRHWTAALWLASLPQGPRLMSEPRGWDPEGPWALETALDVDEKLAHALLAKAPREACLRAASHADGRRRGGFAKLCRERATEMEREELALEARDCAAGSSKAQRI